ncbi:MAG: cytochrome-c oxidase, cbb3-type subunit II [Pseudomonadales bacterium]|nr:cytochrome-c oxidase, cbb3-type subunit II [Pseudomonadales bacterium]
MAFTHDTIERKLPLLMILMALAVSFGGLVEIVPLLFDKDVTQPVEGLMPLNALQLEGRDIYLREGCYLCHSQMIRSLRAETERYGHYSVAGESVYDHPFLWGSERTGPDLARVGGKYSDDWHRAHLHNPRDVVPESIMPAYPWLEKNVLTGDMTGRKMAALRKVGVPYTDDDIKGAQDAVKGHTEQDAVVAYLQQLGTIIKNTR